MVSWRILDSYSNVEVEPSFLLVSLYLIFILVLIWEGGCPPFLSWPSGDQRRHQPPGNLDRCNVIIILNNILLQNATTKIIRMLLRK